MFYISHEFYSGFSSVMILANTSVFDGCCSKSILSLAEQYLSMALMKMDSVYIQGFLHIRDDTVDLAGQWTQLYISQ